MVVEYFCPGTVLNLKRFQLIEYCLGNLPESVPIRTNLSTIPYFSMNFEMGISNPLMSVSAHKISTFYNKSVVVFLLYSMCYYPDKTLHSSVRPPINY